MGKLKLPPEKIAALQAAQRELHDVLSIIDDTEACGVDCQTYRQQWQESMDQISEMLKRFGVTPKVETAKQ